MTGFAARLLFAAAVTVWSATVFAQAEQTPPEDMKAARHGLDEAQHNVGSAYLYGDGVKRDCVAWSTSAGRDPVRA